MGTVLVIDDSEFARMQLRQILEPSGHTVLEAGDGIAGIEAVKSNRAIIQLILCDVNMPGMDGVALARHLKQNEDLKHIPILMVTTEASRDLMATAKTIGVLGWVFKPYDGKRLAESIDRLLNRAA